MPSTARNWLKIAAIVAAVALNYQQYLDRVADLDSISLLFVYGGLFVLITSALLVAAFTPQLWVRLIWALLFVSAGIFHDTFLSATGTYLTYESYVLMVKSIDFAGEAIQQYAGGIASSLPAAFFLLLGLLLPPHYRDGLTPAPVVTKIAITYPLLVAAGLSFLLFMRGGQGSNGLPSPYVPVSLSLLYAYDVYSESQGERELVAIPRAKKAVGHDIVYIVDESIRGDYLDINHENGAASGLTGDWPGAKITNYGMAASATNCSIGTNLILRFGGTREDYRRHINTMPSVWQYARSADLESVYIDAQSEEKLYNGMKDQEISQIDRIIQFKDVPPRDRDIAAARSLVELINDDKQQFILVNKLGAHFPIHDKYPDEYLTHEPALPRGEFTEAAIVKTIFGSSDADWSIYKNSYKNTIEWSIGHFFETLLTGADLDKAVILYTADHGQNFHERGEPGVATHCVYGGKASMEEGLVPMVSITGTETAARLGMNDSSANFNKTSHFNIFPTLLQLMHYEPEAVSEIYGQSLFQEVQDPYKFNVRFNARFGAKPVWVKIKLDKVAYPPK